jgi:hypothetical protein
LRKKLRLKSIGAVDTVAPAAESGVKMETGFVARIFANN